MYKQKTAEALNEHLSGLLFIWQLLQNYAMTWMIC